MSEEEIFHEAMARLSTDRAKYLGLVPRRQTGDACLGGSTARQCRSQRFLDGPALGATVDLSTLVEHPGTMIGQYKLLEQIGEGGFGVVYMAEQEHPVWPQGMLKVLKPGMDSRQVVARFEAERQALALMDHPNIAQIHDGGTTLSGRPYFVMELVRGIPVTEFCDQNQMPVRERLELFVLHLPGGPARAHQGRHPSRPEAIERAGHTARRRARAESNRLWCRKSTRPAADRQDAVHRFGKWSGRRCT